jgi:hypothetical protein
MTSVEIERVRERWPHMSRVRPDITMQGARLHDDTWSALTAEPGRIRGSRVDGPANPQQKARIS